MNALVLLFFLALLLPLPFLAWRAERNFRALLRPPDLDTPLPEGGFPSLSIIIPARNEAPNLARLLPSLASASYPGPLQILVVDDNSTDSTSRIAREFGAQVLSAGELPPGWLGKAHACHLGAAAACGDWLLFTDADTLHNPGGIRRAVAYALQHGLDGLSLLLAEETFGVADKIALMAAFAGLFAGMRPGQPVLNGQYILLHRDVYERSGGFETVRAEPLEDLALAHTLSRQGFRVPLMDGRQFARVRMYQSFPQLWQGLTRWGGGSLKWSGAGAWWSILLITAALLPVPGLLAAVLGLMPVWAAAIGWGLVAAGFVPWAQRAGWWGWSLLAPLGALLVQSAATRGLIAALAGRRITWKGRQIRMRAGDQPLSRV